MTAVVYVEGYDIQAHENTLVTTKYMMDTVTDNKAGKTATAIFGTIKSCLNLLKTLFG